MLLVRCGVCACVAKADCVADGCSSSRGMPTINACIYIYIHVYSQRFVLSAHVCIASLVHQYGKQYQAFLYKIGSRSHSGPKKPNTHIAIHTTLLQYFRRDSQEAVKKMHRHRRLAAKQGDDDILCKNWKRSVGIHTIKALSCLWDAWLMLLLMMRFSHDYVCMRCVCWWGFLMAECLVQKLLSWFENVYDWIMSSFF